jgi:hypothetical protein
MACIVLWASPGYRMATLLPDDGPPRDGSGPTLAAAWGALRIPGGPGAEALDVLDSLARAANERGAIVSLVGHPGPPWTAFATRGQQTVEQWDQAPERALASTLARLEAEPPAPASMRATIPTPQLRSVQGTL